MSCTPYVPDAAKACCGFCPVANPPSPKNQNHAVACGLDVSVKETTSPTVTAVFDARNDATGGARAYVGLEASALGPWVGEQP